MLLAGDIGGTKAHLAVVSADLGPREILMEEKLPSRSFDSLEALVKSFTDRVKYPLTAACFGVAGPITDGSAAITNLGWYPSEDSLKEALKIDSVTLLNDLVATAAAIPELDAEDVVVINEGEETPEGPIGVIAPGTGLGEAFLIWNGSCYTAFPSEGGHTDFPPLNPLETELLGHLWKTYKHVSSERLASGLGIPNIFNFLKVNGTAASPEWLEKELEQADDPTPVIVNAAMAEDPPQICATTLEIFISILGAEAGNLAITLLSSGGIYLGGGIPPRILPALRSGSFMGSFLAKGRLRSFLEKVPVRVITHPETALLGASIHGLEKLAKKD